MAVITTAGENLITSLQSQGKALVIDQIILANISGLDVYASVDRSQGKPSEGQIVSQAGITQAGVVENTTIVYSQVLGSEVGTWSFNWLGLYCSEHDTVVAIAYEPIQEKRATDGNVIGNVITKNFAIEFNGASDLTGINISAESWQVDFSARLLDMDEIQRDIMSQVYGDITSLNSSFDVYHSGGKYFVTKGQAIVKGLLVELDQDLEIFPPYFPCIVYVDVWQAQSMGGIQNKVSFVMSNLAALDDYMNGPVHVYRTACTSILSAGVIGGEDLKTKTTSFSLYHQGNIPEGSTTEKGIMKFASDADSTSESEAINAKLFSEHSHAIRELKTESIYSNITGSTLISLSDLSDLPDVCSLQVGWLQTHGTSAIYSSLIYRKPTGHELAQVCWAGYQATITLSVDTANRMYVRKHTNEGSEDLTIRYIDIIKWG